MHSKIKVFFVLPTLFAGGAERVISFVSQNLDRNKFDVTLVVIGFEKDSKYDVSQIPVIYLNKTRVLNGVFAIMGFIRKHKPQIVVSSISHLNVMMGLISTVFPKVKFIGRHATITSVAKKHKTPKRKYNIAGLLNLDGFGIKSLDAIICQSSDMKHDFLENYDIDENSIKIIHNPVTQVDILKNGEGKPNDIKKFITVGRLSKVKGQMRLLDMLSKLTIPFEFTIIGDGSNKQNVLDKIEELNLSDKVTHITYSDDVFSYLIKHDMFLQGSYSEGFPNALLESCVVGTPVIAFNVPGGTKEIVTDGINGFLVENEEDYIKRLQDDRTWNPKEISDYVYSKFNKEKILGDYQDLFIEVLK